MECYNRSLSVDDENPFIWFHVGKILMEYDLFDDALECFNNSLEINPADDMALYSKGECLMFKNHILKQLPVLIWLLDLIPNI